MISFSISKLPEAEKALVVAACMVVSPVVTAAFVTVFATVDKLDDSVVTCEVSKRYQLVVLHKQACDAWLSLQVDHLF